MHVCLCMYTGTQTHARARTHSHAQVLGVRLVWCGARTTQRQPRGPAKRETKNESVPGAAGVPLVDIRSESAPVAAGVREACFPCLRGINSGWGVGRARGAAAAGGGAREGGECTWVGAPLEIVVPDTGGWECFSICLLDLRAFACARAGTCAYARTHMDAYAHAHTGGWEVFKELVVGVVAVPPSLLLAWQTGACLRLVVQAACAAAAAPGSENLDVNLRGVLVVPA